MVTWFSLDGIVKLSNLTVTNPLLNLLLLAYRARERGDGRLPSYRDADALTRIAYLSLAARLTGWLSNRWRNGLVGAPGRIRDWSQELVVVTGGASGMGKATCELLAKKGANVAAIDLHEFAPTHPNIRSYACDITKMDQIRAVAASIRKDFGGREPLMLCNIAGINNASLILDLDERKVQRMIDVNLTSHFFTTLVFLPAMVKARRGHVLGVSSTMGLAGICHQTDYVAAKHGVVGFLESLRYELDKMYKRPYVRTSTVIVGHTKTPLFSDFDVGAQGRFMGPLLEPEEVAQGIVDALEAQESRWVMLPWGTRLAFGIKALPSFMRDYLQHSSGADGAYKSRPTPQQLGEA